MDSSAVKSFSQRFDSEALLKRGWDPAQSLIDSVKELARESHHLPLSEVTERLTHYETVDRGTLFLTTDKHGRSISPVQRATSMGIEVIALEEGDIAILFSRSGAALINWGFKGKTYFDPQLQAVRVNSWEHAVWIWVYLNSGVKSDWDLVFQALRQRANILTQVSFDPLVPNLPRLDGAQFDAALNIAKRANSNPALEQERSTHFGYRVLEKDSKWSLKPPTESFQSLLGEPLEDLITELCRGKYRGGDLRAVMPVATSRWVRGEPPQIFGDSSNANAVIAAPGDLVTNSLGDVSRSRIAEEPMLVHATCFVIRLKENVSPGYVNRFLNSPEATRQRRLLAREDSFVPAFRADDLKSMRVIESSDFVEECRSLVTESMAT